MPARDLGAKFVCFKCGTKFYDMKKPDPLCPKCGTDQRDSPVNKPGSEGRRARVAPVPKVIEPAPEEAEVLAEGEEEEIQPFDEEEPAAVEDEEI
jgi:uncharacterized protein (TIGR02300 family)